MHNHLSNPSSSGGPALIISTVLIWLLPISQIRYHWGGESYYNFGWFVPFLALWLLLKHLEDLPHKRACTSATILWAGILSTLIILPAHALSEVNPFWRVPLWLQGISAAGFTLRAIHCAFGRKGLIASLFPLFFLLTMIPWPYRLEFMLIDGLTQAVVSIATNGLHLLGYPVQLVGKTFVLGTQQIGVNEACSGIRSLQALFMVTLFLGSIFGQSIRSRVFAVVMLPLIVIVVNSVRAIFLATQVIVNGDEAYETWHDPAGYIAFIVSMGLIYLCLEVINSRSPNPRSDFFPDLHKLLHERKLAFRYHPHCRLIALPIICFVAVEGWFRLQELRHPPQRNLIFSIPPADENSILHAPIHRQISDLLGFSYGQRFFAQLDSGVIAEIYAYGYGPENKLASVSSYGHSPAICMESVGARIVEKYSTLWISLNLLQIPLQHYLFELPRNEGQLHVFWVVWENRSMHMNPELLSSLNYRAQLQQLLLGRRDFSRQVFLMSLRGADSTQTARDLAESWVSEWIASDL